MNRDLLKAELAKRNLSVDELANLVGMNKSTIYRVINGDTWCSVRTAAKIINALKLKPTIATQIFFEDGVAETEHHAESEAKDKSGNP